MKIYENYLSDREFTLIENIINSSSFPWNLTTKVNNNSEEGDFQFLHTLSEKDAKESAFNIFLKKLLITTNAKSIKLIRMRVNLFINTTNKQKGLGYHQDIVGASDIKTLLFYLEESNGFTEFKNKQTVQSKKNRAVIFNATDIHQTVMQTDTLFRKNININFKVS